MNTYATAEFSSLVDSQLVIVTGKGGTGKSTVAAALALYAAENGRSTLVIELGSSDRDESLRLHECFGTKPFLHEPRKLRGHANLYGARYSPYACLVEYIGLKLRSPRLAKILLENKVTRAFLEAVPGLPSLVMLGKIWFELKAKAERRFDIIILDAPASGHAIGLLRAPNMFAKLTGMGPIFEDGRAMADFLSSEKSTKIAYVSLPEEVPLAEAQDFFVLAGQEFSAPKLILNRLYPLAGFACETQGEQSLEAARIFCRERAREESRIAKLFRKTFPNSLELPYVPPSAERSKIASQLFAWMKARSV